MQSGKGSSTLRAELESVWRQTGNKPAELEQLIELPESCKEIWYSFLSLHNSRSYGMSMNPISYSDIKSFFDLFEVKPEVWEIQAIKALDVVAMKASSKEQEASKKKRK